MDVTPLDIQQIKSNFCKHNGFSDTNTPYKEVIVSFNFTNFIEKMLKSASVNCNTSLRLKG